MLLTRQQDAITTHITATFWSNRTSIHHLSGVEPSKLFVILTSIPWALSTFHSLTVLKALSFLNDIWKGGKISFFIWLYNFLLLIFGTPAQAVHKLQNHIACSTNKEKKVQILVPSHTAWDLKLHLPHFKKVFRLLGLLGYFYMTLSFGPRFDFHPSLHYRIISTQFQQNQYTPIHLGFVTDIFRGKKSFYQKSCSAGRWAWSEELLLSMPQTLHSIEHLLVELNKITNSSCKAF